MITMLLGGLWHGAAWTFVVWGALHGGYLVVHKLARGGRVSSDPVRWGDTPAILVTFAFVNLGWVFFRADTFGAAFDMLRAIATFQGGLTPASDLVLIAILGLVALAIDLLAQRELEPMVVLRRAPALAGAAVAFAVAAIVVFSGGTPEPFIYFQF
jgi:D-alanyl-lipoteichoic acid acyltransferase DltB (MBOAT superfamily)